tara:strand:+ start:22616 stop:22741 length:126 start_codon:yes stop_codon:yes gene_type:complete
MNTLLLTEKLLVVLGEPRIKKQRVKINPLLIKRYTNGKEKN